MTNTPNPKIRFKRSDGTDYPNWRVVRLGDICDIIGGGTPASNIRAYWNGGIVWYTPSELNCKFMSHSQRTISTLGLKKSSAKILPIGTLLLSSRATIGDVAIATTPCTTNQGFQNLIVHKNQCNEFWYYWILKHKQEFMRRASGSTFLEINKTEIAKIKAHTPHLDEQQKIAAFFSNLDAVMTAHAQKVEYLKQYKKYFMQNLFPQTSETTPKIRFKRSDGTDYPDWRVVRLGDIADIKMGSSPKSENYNSVANGMPLFQGNADIKNRRTQPRIWTTEITQKCYVNDILMCVRAPVGDIAISKHNGVIGRGMCSISTQNNKYLYQYLIFVENKWGKYSQGSTFESINSKDIKSFKLLIPHLDEQQKIAVFFSNLDTMITAYTQKVEYLKKYKKSLMQNMFV